jgi:hypothetical protein
MNRYRTKMPNTSGLETREALAEPSSNLLFKKSGSVIRAFFIRGVFVTSVRESRDDGGVASQVGRSR